MLRVPEFMKRSLEIFFSISIDREFLKRIIYDSISPVITFLVCAKIMYKFSLSSFPIKSKHLVLGNFFMQMALEFI